LPDENFNFNKKSNNAKRRSEKGKTNCLKARKKPNFTCGGIAVPLSKQIHKLQA